jgi:hypothetical protein
MGPQMPVISHVARPLSRRAVFDELEKAYRRIVIGLRLEGKKEDWVPAWYAHLPSGERARIKLIGRKGPLVEFTTREGSLILLAPDAVVVTIESQPEDSEGFPLEFLDSAEEDDTPAVE